MGYKLSLPKDGKEGFSVAPDSVLFDDKLTGDATRVYLYLVRHRLHGSPEVGEVGYRRIAERLGVSVKTVARSIKALEERGHILIDRSLTRQSYTLCSDRFRVEDE